MFRPSHGFVRRIALGGSVAHCKSFMPTVAAVVRKTRRSSHKPLALLAVAGTATTGGYCSMTRDHEGDKIHDFFCHFALLHDTITTSTSTSTSAITTHCDANPTTPKRETRLKRKKTTHYYDSNQDFSKREAKLRRKKTVLKVAASLERLNTKQQVSRLRLMEDEMLTRWELDEEGWRKLPSRAWPEYQPNPKQLEKIRVEIERLGCIDTILAKKKNRGSQTLDNSPEVSQCTTLLFHMATSLVFYNIDNDAGLALYERLAKLGHSDSMVACGIVLVEGLGVTPREHEGLAWLEKAIEVQGTDPSSLSSAQASYELGVIYYTGIDGVVEEDPEKAFELFERAAKSDHTSALYMVADCLVEGEGTKRDVAKAIPLLYKAAERGHRYSRQRIRELLENGGYPL